MPKPSGDMKAKKRAQLGQAGNTARKVSQPAKTLANRRLRAKGKAGVRRELEGLEGGRAVSDG